MLSRRVQRIGLSPTLGVSDQARRLRAEGVDLLDFSAGQPDFPTPDEIKAAGKHAIDENRTGYTANAGIAELRTAIAEMLRRDRGLAYEPDQVLISPGGKASLCFTFLALLDPGDQVLVPLPYWVSYPEQIKLAEAEPVYVTCREENGFKLTPDDLEAAITPRTRAVVLNYPSNPTGASYDREELEALAAVSVRHGLWIVADEIYSRLVYDDRKFTSVAEIDPEVRDRTVVIDGMSKTYSMTGWRLGYAVGPREVIAGMSRLQSHCTSNATSITQWAGLAGLLEVPDAELERRTREFQTRRDEVVATLRRIPGIECVEPQGAFYVFPNVSGCFGEGERRLTSGDDVARYLLETARIAVVPGEGFGSPRHIRLSYACSIEQIREGLGRMAEALGGRVARQGG